MTDPVMQRVEGDDAYDAVIVGAGHNGLVCAAYLARAGYRVAVVERRDTVERPNSANCRQWAGSRPTGLRVNLRQSSNVYLSAR